MCDKESKANLRSGPRIGNRIKAALAAFVLSLSLAAPVAAGPLEDGIKAANRKDYGTALRLLRPLAEQGNSQAQGLLGFMYEIGKVVPQDYTEAAKWYRKGAEQGDRQAQYNLAIMYANGRGVPHDEAESDRWYRKAAEQGDASAQSIVGSAYLFGRGAPMDLVQAYMWLNLAAHGGDHGAAQTRDGLEPFMTAEQIAEAQRLTREWKPKWPATAVRRGLVHILEDAALGYTLKGGTSIALLGNYAASFAGAASLHGDSALPAQAAIQQALAPPHTWR
jgi:uncharacterized protein